MNKTQDKSPDASNQHPDHVATLKRTIDSLDYMGPKWRETVIAADRALNGLVEQLESLREALEFYADYDNWLWPAPGVESPVIRDDVEGNRARAALARLSNPAKIPNDG